MKYKYTVKDGDFLSAGESSSNLKAALKKIGIPSNVIRKVAIAMYEAEINMVIHANGGEIFAEIFPDKISIILKDQGPGIKDIELAMQEGYSTATEEIRSLGFGAGMGLPNMKRNSDFLKIESEVSKGTTVYLDINL